MSAVRLRPKKQRYVLSTRAPKNTLGSGGEWTVLPLLIFETFAYYVTSVPDAKRATKLALTTVI